MATGRAYGKHRRPHENYAMRQIVLEKIGFLDYEQYLKSPLWCGIRETVFEKHGSNCCICGESTNQIHHDSYSEDVLRGRGSFLQFLYPICGTCHKRIEFDDSGNKLPFWGVRKKFKASFPEKRVRDKRKKKYKPAKPCVPIPKDIPPDDLVKNLRTCIKCRVTQGLRKFDWVYDRKIRLCKKCCLKLYSAGRVEEIKAYEALD